jgi:1-acyl-sn-glycerol-3-phosphate acyltransferase
VPPKPSLLSRLVRGAIVWLFRRWRFSVAGTAPAVPRYVIAAAPHTSNWDFVVFLGVTHQLGIAPRFMGKASLFRWPLGRFMREMGGVPVDRSTRAFQAQAMVEAFAGHEHFALVVAPEGTRKSDGAWKSGFWHIARGAGVPVVPAFLDYATRRAGIGPAMTMTDDYAADMARLAAYFRSVLPGHPRWDAMAALSDTSAPAGR